MTKRIFIQISTANAIDPESLIAAIQKAYAVLRELDATVSNDPRGQVHWQIETIRKQSPLLLGFTGEPRTRKTDPVPVIQKQLLTGVKQLAGTPEKKPRKKSAKRKKTAPRVEYSERFLVALQKFSKLQKRPDLGEIDIYTSRTDRVSITDKVVQSIDRLLGPKYESSGSIIGSLDSITVHRGHEFRVWDEESGRPVTCAFPKEMLGTVKEHLKKRVLVYGQVQRNEQGTPVRIQVEGIDKMKDESQLPTIKEMSGFVDDITGGKSINDYLEDIRG